MGMIRNLLRLNALPFRGDVEPPVPDRLEDPYLHVGQEHAPMRMNGQFVTYFRGSMASPQNVELPPAMAADAPAILVPVEWHGTRPGTGVNDIESMIPEGMYE